MAQTKLYIGNLPYRLRKEQLVDFFAGCGDIVDARIIKDKNTGRSKGFAFVTFANESDTQSALDMDGVELEGRPLKINFANDKDSNGSAPAQQDVNTGSGHAAPQRSNQTANAARTGGQGATNASSVQKASGVESRNRAVDIVIGIAIGLVAGLLICQLL